MFIVEFWGSLDTFGRLSIFGITAFVAFSIYGIRTNKDYKQIAEKIFDKIEPYYDSHPLIFAAIVFALIILVMAIAYNPD